MKRFFCYLLVLTLIMCLVGCSGNNNGKGIPKILSPELIKVLCEMGHSDRIVIADGNFPVESVGKMQK